MKGLSVILTLVLLLFAIWLPGRLRAAGKLPAGKAAAIGFAKSPDAPLFMKL